MDEARSARVAVIFYSMTGNVAALARAIARGAADGGARVRLRRIEETLPATRISAAARRAQEAFADVPIATQDDLVWADGVAFGSPTRFGNMASQLKEFIDGTGALWLKGALVGKLAAVFTSTGTQHGGQETTLLTMMVPLFHLGFIVMGLPYAESEQMEMGTIHGGSPYGVSSVSGMEAARGPTELDLQLAQALGRRLARGAARLRD